MNATAESRAAFELVAPEHVSLRFTLAGRGDRVSALMLDLTIQLGLVLAAAVFIQAFSGAGTAVFVLLSFLVRNFYFTVAETYWRGQTPGKRKMGIRVVARDGGPLNVDQVFARNLTRDLEVFLPITLLLAPEALIPDAGPWLKLMLAAWVLAVAIVPFANRHRARIGDLVAGTLVVRGPHAALDIDLVEGDPLRHAEDLAAYSFTPQQLAIYGIRELHVLESVLRRPPSERRDELLDAIAEKILRKTQWEPHRTGIDVPLFLQAFYTAQRAHLEKKLLFGTRRERKVR